VVQAANASSIPVALIMTIDNRAAEILVIAFMKVLRLHEWIMA
jgi:hypothetical protein